MLNEWRNVLWSQCSEYQNQKKKIVIPLRMKEKNICQITQIAKQIGISRNEWIVQAIEYALNNMEEKEE